eukprot:1318336-Amorphochlora_amoeboformis.AAC.1
MLPTSKRPRKLENHRPPYRMLPFCEPTRHTNTLKPKFTPQQPLTDSQRTTFSPPLNLSCLRLHLEGVEFPVAVFGRVSGSVLPESNRFGSAFRSGRYAA